MPKRIIHIFIPFLASFLFIWFLVYNLQTVQATVNTLNRPQEPLVTNGYDYPSLVGSDIDELVLYRNNGGMWEPIPFQIDEVSITGTFVMSEDGVFDANDELVFMARDAGDMAMDWPNDAEARLNPRYVLTATDPLDPAGIGWVYLYRSSTLARSTDSYITWDEPSETLTGISYTVGFDTENFFGIADVTVNGTPVDILDRQKIRGDVVVLFFGSEISRTTFTEETLLSFITQTVTIDFPALGPIRAASGADLFGFSFYGAKAELNLALPLEDISIAPFTVAHFEYFQTSFDLNDPAGTGLSPATYYDSNSTTATIDGLSDAIPTFPPVDWTQIDGSLGGWVTLQSINPANGTLTNYYLDDNTVDPDDTGDQQSYGDHGYRVDDPNGTVTIDQTLYLQAGGIGNVGVTYQSWFENPLTYITSAELFDGNVAIYLPISVLE